MSTADAIALFQTCRRRLWCSMCSKRGGACAAAVWGPLACLADLLQARQERKGGPAGFGVVRQLLQGRRDLHTCPSWRSDCWLLRGAHIGTRNKEQPVAWVHC